jgi:serine/threonine-protein kinase
VNASGNPELDYLSDGITENIINRISFAAHLKMISHNSVFRYKGKEIDSRKVGRELGVQAILLGRVVQHGNNLSVSAELVGVEDGRHIWGEHYERTATDLSFLQKDLANDIANGLRLQFDSVEQMQSRKSYTEKVEAYKLYLKGRYFWNKRTEAGLRKGVEYFQQAIEQDPNYALAYAGLADSYIILANWRYAPPSDSYAKAKAAALRALELDSHLPEAMTSLAYTTLLYERDWKASESRFQQALAVNPNYASAHHFYSICLMTSGRQSEALAEITRAQDLDPLSLIINSVHGWIYYEGRDFDRAVDQFTKTLEMDPKYVPALLDLGATYLRKGEYGKAISKFEEAKTVGGETGRILADLAQAYALSDRRPEALEILRRLEHPSAPGFVSTWDLALVHTAMGNNTRAIELLERAADERVGWIILLGVDPAFDSLRGEPRFAKLIQQVRIPKPSQS